MNETSADEEKTRRFLAWLSQGHSSRSPPPRVFYVNFPTESSTFLAAVVRHDSLVICQPRNRTGDA